MSNDHYREWDAAYLLGALPVAERLEFERHLESCDTCAKHLAELSGMPGILSRLQVDEALAVPEQDEAQTRSDDGRILTALLRQDRARGRRLAAVAAACVLSAGLGAGAAVVLEAGSAETQSVSMEPVGSSRIRADVTVTAKAWGTRLDWSCWYDKELERPRPDSYELVVITRAGKDVVVATWAATEGTSRHLAASSSIATDDIESVNIRALGTTRPLAVARL